MPNMNPLSLTVKKLWSVSKFVIDRRANGWADAQTDRVITIIGTRIVARPNLLYTPYNSRT